MSRANTLKTSSFYETYQGFDLVADSTNPAQPITISADGGKFTNGAYSVRLTFAPNVKKVASDAASETATATVTWKLRDIRKLRATTTP